MQQMKLNSMELCINCDCKSQSMARHLKQKGILLLFILPHSEVVLMNQFKANMYFTLLKPVGLHKIYVIQ